MRRTDAEFEEFATARARQLYRAARLLCGDHFSAEDLVQETLGRLYSRWSRVARADNPDAYAQTVLFRTFVSGRRRRSATEVPRAELQALAAQDIGPDTVLRLTVTRALAELAPTDRAVLVLRFLLDQDVATTADRLGLTGSAVRTRTSRALARLRARLGTDLLIDQGADHG